MERAEAFKTLRLDVSADGRMVENAYWTLVRQAQRRAANDGDAGGEIDRLNEAYTMLAPDAHVVERPRATRPAGESGGTGVEFLDGFADWCADEWGKIRERWVGRNLEVGVIGGSALIMLLFAVGAGANLFGVFAPMLAILVTIWAPWRKIT